MKMHYSGGVIFEEGSRLKGWAVCCTGEQTEQININGNHTINKEEVTCKKCIALMKKQTEFKEKHPDIWEKYHKKGYCL